MSYLQLDDRFAEHPKMLGLSAVAFRLHVSALCFVARLLTDGAISGGSLRVILASSGGTKKHVEELVKANLWEDAGSGGYRIHDYLDWNKPREQIETEVADRRERAQKAARARWGEKDA